MARIPPAKWFRRGDRLHVQAQQIWLILTSMIMASERDPSNPFLVTYGQLAKVMGYEDARAGHTLGRQLGIVGNYCKMNDLPPLNVVVINKQTGQPGAEVVLRRGESVASEQAAAMREDWFLIRVPTTGTFRQVWAAM